jgi:DNA phosphorothioation-dependent restriction protein DptH
MMFLSTQFVKSIRGLNKHCSLYVDGDKKITKIKDKAFWELNLEDIHNGDN